MKGRLLWLFLLLPVQQIQAQTHRITGVVLDGNTVNLLGGVHIHDKTDQSIYTTDSSGHFEINAPFPSVQLKFELPGYHTVQKDILPDQNFSTVFLYKNTISRQEESAPQDSVTIGVTSKRNFTMPVAIRTHDDETYEKVTENPFEPTRHFPLSSFIMNANDAAYCNVRRFITAKQLPPSEAVRIEEMVNYFPYRYTRDTGGLNPLSLQTVITTCPWHPGDRLMRIAVQAQSLPADTVIANNIVLLIDISGSMDRANKLPLLKKAFSVLANQLDSSDKISVVVYAGDVSVALPPTPCNEKDKILDVIHNLYAGGSTAGGAGIEKAFKLAKESFIPHGNNRIIIATDGDFNVGKTSDEDMRRLVTKYHNWGIYLTCIGVGMGNYKDSKLETLAQWGQGNFVYIDNEQEAESLFNKENYRKILISTASNARIKVIFNPDVISSYRLIGYEGDPGGKHHGTSAYFPGGEIGYGQSITAFYELQPVMDTGPSHNGRQAEPPATVVIQYQTVHDGKEHVTIQEASDKVIEFKRASDDFQFATAVTLFGMLLRQSSYADKGNYQMVESIIRHLKGKYDKEEHKACLKLVEKASRLPVISFN